MAPNDTHKQRAILYVDDEVHSLKYFEKDFSDSFTILCAPSVDRALALLAEKGNDIGVLITDQRMPGRTGVELLATVRQNWPQVNRILTTAYADLEVGVWDCSKAFDDLSGFVRSPSGVGVDVDDGEIVAQRVLKKILLRCDCHCRIKV